MTQNVVIIYLVSFVLGKLPISIPYTTKLSSGKTFTVFADFTSSANVFP